MVLWRSGTPARLWKSRFLDEQGREFRMDLSCGFDTEVAELRKLPRRLQQEIAHDNTVRFLFGGVAGKARSMKRESRSQALTWTKKGTTT